TETYWKALTAGQSGFGPPTIFAAERLSTKIVAEVKGFVPEDHFDSRQIGLLDRVSQFAVVAAREAIAQSGLSFRDGLGERTAAIVGSGIGGQTTQDDAFKRIYGENAPRVHPLIIPRTMPNAPASQISMFFGIKGPTYAVSTACASATHSIGQAFHLVRAGSVTCAVTGGAEAQPTHRTVKACEAMRTLAPHTRLAGTQRHGAGGRRGGPCAGSSRTCRCALCRHPRRNRRFRHERGCGRSHGTGSGRHGARHGRRARRRGAPPRRSRLRQRPWH